MHRWHLPIWPPPWVCTDFKKLNVTQRKELITRNRRCFRCLATGHRAKECQKTRECGVDGCTSKTHSGYLHEPGQRTGEAVIPQQIEREKQENDSHSHLTETADEDDTSRTYTTRRDEHVSLMILPALLCNGKKKLKVNVMLDPCSAGS